MWMKITRATLTPYNEHSASSKTHCTNTDLKHAYLAQAAEMNFRKPDFHAHWWSHSVAPIRLPPPGCESTPPPPPFSSSNVKNWEHIWWSGNSLEKGDNEVSQLWISTRQFSTSPFATQSTAGETDVGCLWMTTRLLEEEIGVPFAPDSSQQGPKTTPHYKPSYITHPQVPDQECSRIHTLHTDTETYRQAPPYNHSPPHPCSQCYPSSA